MGATMPAGLPKKVSASDRRLRADGAVPLQVMVPARIKREVSLRAAQEGTTQRTIILRGLKAIGVMVKKDKLCDRRKLR